MNKTYWLVIDDDGFQHIEQGEDLLDLYDVCDYYVQTVVKLDEGAVEELKEKDNDSSD